MTCRPAFLALAALLWTTPAHALPVGVLAFQETYDAPLPVSDWLSRAWGGASYQPEPGALRLDAPAYGDFLELWKHIVPSPGGAVFEADVAALQLHRFSMDLVNTPVETFVTQDAPDLGEVLGTPPVSWDGVHFAMHDFGFAFCLILDSATRGCAWGPYPVAGAATTLRLEAQADGVVRATVLRGGTADWTAAWAVPETMPLDYDFLMLHTWNVGRSSSYRVEEVRMGPSGV